MPETREPERVEVNQRALVEKVLARYPEEFTVLRELIQNADDVGATEVQIEFRTVDYDELPVGANSNANGINGTVPGLNNITLSKWIVRNNGEPFEHEDWRRLTTIGDGNPGLQKIGAFGVGFYSVFSITESPKVISGGKSLSIFFKKDELYYTEDNNCPDSKWTSIEMKLKGDMRDSFPKPFDLARFLVTTMTFMSCLTTTSVFLDDDVIFKVVKFREEPSSICIPSDMNRTSVGRTMTIKTVSVATQEITVDMTNCTLAAAVGTSRPPAQQPDKDNVPNNRKFWEFPENGGKSEAPKVISQQRTHTARYIVYSAEVTAHPSDGLREGLKAMTKKDPPSKFNFEMVYFSKEEHDARAEEERNDPKMGSVFRGPQGLFPQLDGDGGYMSRVFIGQSTAQTTGIGGHLSGRFIPTVERGSIDLTNHHIAKWNEELLYVGGFLARLVYETEINGISDTLSSAPSTDKALYAMRYFSFDTSTPDAKVSNILRDAFFSCSRSDHFPILSSSGIRHTKDVRQYDKDFTPFMTMPVLHPTKPGSPPSLIDALTWRYKVPAYRFSDVVDVLKGRIFQDKEMTGLLRWWVGLYETSQVPDDGVRAEVMKEAKLNIGSPKREVTLDNISKFVGPLWVQWLQPDDALPLDTIPFLFTRGLNLEIISSAFPWQPMTITNWLCHLISEDVDSAHDIRKSESYSDRVLVVLGNLWSTLPKDDPTKNEAKEFMKDVPWIATTQGFRKASDAYFDEVDIFGDIPVITANLSEPGVFTVLTDFGIKDHLDFDELFAKAETLNSWSIKKMVRYLGKIHVKPEDIQNQAIFPSEKGERNRSAELYIPHEGVRQLGLPILSWPEAISTNDEEILTELGFPKHPPLEKIIKIAGSDDPGTRHAAFKYLSENFEEVYEDEYDPLEHEGAFIPAIKGSVECVGAHKDVYSDPSWAEMGFLTVHDSVDSRMKSRLEIREDPSAEQVIEIFKGKQPKDHGTAVKWFECLAKKQVLSPEHHQELAGIPIVPIKDPAFDDDSNSPPIRMVTPRECFINDGQYCTDHHYRRIFTFVDFGEHANNFLKACGVKTKPDCSDIVNILLKNPIDFLKNTEGKRDPEKYLNELRLIATGYDGLPCECKQKMEKAPIFVGRRVSGVLDTDETTTRTEFLLTPSQVLIAGGLENHRSFHQDIWLAPQEDILERLYESVGSKYLSDRIIYNVKPGKKNTRPDCKDVRKRILEKLPIFLHGLDERLKKPSMDLLKSHFLVRGCEDLKVEKKLQSDYCSSQPEEYPVPAEITTDDSLVTLWLTGLEGVEMYDIAAALCRLLVKSPKKHDVYCLVTVLKTDKEVLQRRGYNINVDWNKGTQNSDDRKDETDGKEPQEEAHVVPLVLSDDEQYSCCIPFLRLPEVCSFALNGEKTTLTVKGGEINDLIDKTLEQLSVGEATPQEQYERNRDYRGTGKKATNVEYCDEQKCTDLEKCEPEDGATGSIIIWKQRTAQEEIPPDDLERFVTIIDELRGVFGLNATNFNIFWHPEDHELMGFNRKGGIYLNLAHYISKHLHQPSGMAYIEWYYIIVHEMAHVRTPFHDEHHELLVSSLIIYFLTSLYKVKPVLEYLG